MTRLEVTKTHKLYINGQFPRSESGRSLIVKDSKGGTLAHACQASRKDLRDAVVAARGAVDGWQKRSAYNRGQILYRMAEMMEAKRQEFVELLENAPRVPAKPSRSTKSRMSADAEVTASIDRLIAFAGWADKFSQVLGCNNSVNGPYYNFTVAEGTGVTAVVAPDSPSLIGLVSLVAPAVCSGCTVVALGSEREPLTTSVLGEVCGTSDVPAGVINLLTGIRSELVPQIAEHRDIDAVVGANLGADQSAALRHGASNNVKRVAILDVPPDQWLDSELLESPWTIERTVEMKTIWHPSAS